MANLRNLKKDIDYLTEEVLSDSYLAIYFHPERRDRVLALMQECVDMRNELFRQVNNPPEKNNASLMRKHYAHIRRTLLDTVHRLFDELSGIAAATAPK